MIFWPPPLPFAGPAHGGAAIRDTPVPIRTAAASKVLHLLAYAEARGLPRAELIARFELDPAALEDVDGRVPLTAIVGLWNELPALLGDPDMPLNLLRHAAAADPPLPVLLFMASATLGDGLLRMVRYERLGYDVADQPTSALVLDGPLAHVTLRHERAAVVPPTGAVLYTLAAVLTMARAATGRGITPVSVRLRHPAPRQIDRYQEHFRAPITFDAPRDVLTLRASDLALPHPEASRTLLAIAERHADHSMARLPERDDLLSALRRAVHARLPDGDVTLEKLARPLGMSARTLQRRLEAEGTSLRRLVDDERRALALHHIQNPATPLSDIALLVGFADASAFTRAFSRWTHRSPTEYRRSLA